MKRRVFCVAGVFALVTRAGAADAQSRRGPAVIGWLNSSSRNGRLHLLRAFEDGLAALGWKRGENTVIEEVWADGSMDRLPALARQLAQKRPAVMVAAPF